MNSTVQADPWSPYASGNKHHPVPEPEIYGLLSVLTAASIYVIAKTVREQKRNK